MDDEHTFSRRAFLSKGSAWMLLFAAQNPFRFILSSRTRPSIYWSASEVPGLRSVSAVRKSVEAGIAGQSYAAIREAVRGSRDAGPILPSTPVVGRSPASIANANPDFYVTNAAGQRLLQAAFVTVLEDDPVFAEPALDQLECLFDESKWIQWIDQAHVRFGHPVDLRTGMLAEAIGLTFDWLFPYLTEAKRKSIVNGLDRRAIQPFKTALAQDPWWLRDKNNWMTTIVGGLGIAGMALIDEHPDSDFLIEFALAQMEDYLSIYGPNGEFNESVSYANATVRPVAVFEAGRYSSGGSNNRLASYPFPETCQWIQYLTLPPGRVAAFGDSHVDRPPWTSYIAAVAAASRDPVLQWFHETFGEETTDPVAFLWHDLTLRAISPLDAGLPLGKAFPAHGGCLVARTDWSPVAARCIVYGKAGREENHEHNDIGNLCIDALGERLIVDLGSPSGYPADYFDESRYRYYNASVHGHNVLMFDETEMRVPVRKRGEPIGNQATRLSGQIVRSEFADDKGAVWIIDCTNAYDEVIQVVRSVLFLTPGVVVVLDQASLPREREVSLRWHTIRSCTPGDNGAFQFKTERSRLVGQVVPLAGNMSFRSRHHEYKAPYNRDREGDLLEQRHEPYVEILAKTSQFEAATLFVAGPVGETTVWVPRSDGWTLQGSDVKCKVTIEENKIAIVDTRDDRMLEVNRLA